MATRCTAQQLAEAVTIWSIDTNFNQCRLSEIEDTDGLKPLDLLISMVRIFIHGFCEKLETEGDDYKQGILLSKQNFIDYLKHHCYLLAESNGCFDLILTCAFVSHEVCNVTFYFQCFHFSRVAYKLLSKVLEDKFGDMFNTDSGWEELMAYCRKIHAAVLPSKENRPSDYDTEYEYPEFHKDSKAKYRTFRKEPAAKELSSEDRLIHQEGFDCSDPDAKQRFGQRSSKEITDEELFDSKDIVDAVEDPNFDGDNKITRGQIYHENIKSNRNRQKDVSREKEGLESDTEKPDSKSIEMTKETETDSSDIEDLLDDEGSDDCHRNYETTGGQTYLERIKNRLNFLKNMQREEEQLEFVNEEHRAVFIESDISNGTTEKTSSESPVTVESSDNEGSDDGQTTRIQTSLERIKTLLNYLKNREREEEQLEFVNDEHKAVFIESDISNGTTEETSSESPVTVESSDHEGSDDGQTTGSQTNLERIKNRLNHLKNMEREEERLEFINEEHKAVFIESDISNGTTEETSSESPVTVESSDHEGSDDGQTTGIQTNIERIKTLLNYLKNREREEEQLEFVNEEHKAVFIESDISNGKTEETSSESSGTVESSDDESLADDPIYWEYETMKRRVLRKRITDSKEHLRDVLDRLAMIKRKVNPEIIPSNEYNIPISDNEDIQALEKCVIKANFSDWGIRLEEEDVECIKKEICDQKNEKLDKLSEKRIRPEDITDGEIFQNVIDIFDPPDDEDQCEICDGRMLLFKNKWIEDFHRRFPDNMSNFLIPAEFRSGQEEL